MNIAVCEDDKDQLEAITCLLEEYSREHTDLTIKVSGYTHPLLLCLDVEIAIPYDLFILDILMPEMNGIEVGRQIRQFLPHATIIYLTSSGDYALPSFSVYAFQYLLKPADAKTLFPVLDAYFSSVKSSTSPSWTIKTSEGIYCVKYSSIRYIEYLNRCIYYYLNDNTVIKSQSIRESFAVSIAGLLGDSRFLKIAASFVVNMDYIKIINKKSFILDNDVTLQVSRQYIHECRERYMDYLLRGR